MEKSRSTHTDYAEGKTRTYDIDDACRYITQEFPIRRSCEELEKLLDSKDVSVDFLKKKMGRAYAVQIGKWLTSVSIERDSAIKILLALKINDISEAERFIFRTCSDRAEAFYERDHEDLIAIYCLRNQLGLLKYKELIEKYKNLTVENDVLGTDSIGNARDTIELAREFDDVNSLEALENFFTCNSVYFGDFNRAAYEIFQDYYNMVIKDIEISRAEFREANVRHKIGLVDICKAMATIPNKRKKTGLNLIQKIIARKEPTDRDKLSEILNKKTQVPRKHLMVLFLLTEGEVVDYRDSINRLNHDLRTCGMPSLDSRSPFDWMVMNALFSVEADGNNPIDRMKMVAKKVFGVDDDELR
ncbi:MAG: hypothetical protein FWC91_04360 [Defluviitaleaceae bacterium]|nr:hypothetical protein [Defluviitaleaceae bacterium]